MAGNFDDRYTEYQTDRSALRKFVRRLYLASARAKLEGPTLDFGCGIGELLATLPAGSMGLEYNEATVAFCRAKGLDVHWYDGFADGWALTAVPPERRFQSMVISHVLEHFDQPAPILQALMRSARGLGVQRILAIVPGKSGFRIDDTHRCFVDKAMLCDEASWAASGFRVAKAGYFPGNVRKIGDWFPHHELQVVFEGT